MTITHDTMTVETVLQSVRQLAPSIFDRAGEIVDMYSLPVKNRPPGWSVSIDESSRLFDKIGPRNFAEVSGRKEIFSVDSEDARVDRVAQSGGVLGESVHDGLNVRRRTGNNAQDLTRRCLLLQGLGEITVAPLQFVEQPHILDRDHRLSSKRLE